MKRVNKDYLFSIDTHFHIYKQYKLEFLLDCAYKHLMSHANGEKEDLFCMPVLFLADDINSTGFELLNNSLISEHQKNETGWRKDMEHQDENSVLLRKNKLEQMLVVRGHQLMSSEYLEVLVIGQKVGVLSDHQTVNDIIQAYKDQSLVILPWAVGKWLGSRGQVINEMLKEYKNNDFALGDNGGRPWIWNKISQFDQAKAKGFPVLRGSDPLPLNGEEKKAGRYGLTIKGNAGVQLTGTSIIELVKSDFRHIKSFGAQESICNFIINQIKLRIHK